MAKSIEKLQRLSLKVSGLAHSDRAQEIKPLAGGWDYRSVGQREIAEDKGWISAEHRYFNGSCSA